MGTEGKPAVENPSETEAKSAQELHPFSSVVELINGDFLVVRPETANDEIKRDVALRDYVLSSDDADVQRTRAGETTSETFKALMLLQRLIVHWTGRPTITVGMLRSLHAYEIDLIFAGLAESRKAMIEHYEKKKQARSTATS